MNSTWQELDFHRSLSLFRCRVPVREWLIHFWWCFCLDLMVDQSFLRLCLWSSLLWNSCLFPCLEIAAGLKVVNLLFFISCSNFTRIYSNLLFLFYQQLLISSLFYRSYLRFTFVILLTYSHMISINYIFNLHTLVFWNSIHLEVASDTFCFLINSSWLLVFTFTILLFFYFMFNLYCWKGIHFS